MEKEIEVSPLTEEYKKETGKEIFHSGAGGYTIAYVKWLEDKITATKYHKNWNL